MPPYDSDSDDDDDLGAQAGFTETNVLLGYTQAEDDDGDDSNGETVSRLGGRPEWLGDETETESGIETGTVMPPPALLRCGACRALMVLLLQLNGALPDRFPGHARRLYVFACRNKGCRRRPGCVRAVRAVRVAGGGEEEEKEVAAKVAAAAAAEKAAAEKAKKTAPMGEALFGVANPFSGGSSSANPFAANPFSAPAPGANPFSLGGTSAAKTSSAAAPAPAPARTAADPAADLPNTFAATLSLGLDAAKQAAPSAPAEPAEPAEPWPAESAWPAAYPVRWITDAEYETLEPTAETLPTGTTTAMDLDEGPSTGGGGGSGKEDKFVFESSIDAAFQKFADRVAQNSEQVLRYEFGGQPLLYSRGDAVARVWETEPPSLPACPRCRARRVFEVQLMPYAIDRLEAAEAGLDGMDWGTVVVGVCERDCGGEGGRPTYVEEWVGVQWES